MVLTKGNAVRYVYTVGVMVTGAFLAELIGGFESPLLWPVLFSLGVVWVAYYNYSLLPRFDYLAQREEGETERGG